MAYILRAASLGKKSMPNLAELLGVKVYTSEDTIPQDDYAFRWGCTSKNLGQTKVVNKSSAIDETSDKKGFRVKLAAQGLAPRTWSTLKEYIEGIESYGPVGRVLVRPSFHQRSQGIHDCTKLSEVVVAIEKISGPYYISEYIAKQREFRVFVCSGRIAWMIEKHPQSSEEVSWGCVSTGDFDYVPWTEWPQEISECALRAMAVSDLDFGAVDIIVKDSEAFALEINTACYLTPYYTKCVAKVFKHVIQNGRDHFDLPSSFSWDSVIHPAIQKDL